MKKKDKLFDEYCTMLEKKQSGRSRVVKAITILRFTGSEELYKNLIWFGYKKGKEETCS